MEHTKDCIVNAEHAALRDITRPYETLAWTTALEMVRARLEGAERTRKLYLDCDYTRGRYEAFFDLLQEMMERGKP